MLRQWAERQHAGSGVLALATVVLMAFVLLSIRDGELAADAVRKFGLVMAGAHALAHLFIAQSLRYLCSRHIDGAREALAAYVNPHRIGHLDLGVTWLVFYLAMPWIA